MSAEFVQLGGGMRGYLALPATSAAAPGVLVFQEAFGINDYMQRECRRLADDGYVALAPDLFDGQVYGYGDREAVFARLQTLRDETMLKYVDASLVYLEGHPAVKRGPFGAVGFCMGGRLAFLTATARAPRIGAAASFYGGGIAAEQKRHFDPLLDRVTALQGALLLIYGADDEGIPPREHARLAEALSSHKKDYTLHVFPDAGHGFASTDRESYRPVQAEQAWKETLALFARTL
ncbi:MAG TPA: dienelactone hydrolase family protein [Candidatus Elarobacter sp.]